MAVPLEELTVCETHLQVKVICVETEGRKPQSPGAMQQTLQTWVIKAFTIHNET